MKLISILVLFLAVSSAFGQKPNDVIATAKGLSFTYNSLSDNGRKVFENRKQIIADTRSEIFAQMFTEILLETEAKAAGTTPESLIAAAYKKIPSPTEVEIKAVYDANKTEIGDRQIGDVRPQIVEYLQKTKESKTLQELLAGLRLKYKASVGKDINAPTLKPSDVVFTVNGRAITAAAFETANKTALYDIEAEVADVIQDDLNAVVLSALIGEEAKERKVEVSDVIAAEITNKLRDFTEDEKAGLEADLRKRLFEKYKVKILFRGPAPYVQNISVDDDPSRGPLNAPVTVVMFSDFQCPACSATHPVLDKVLETFGNKVRFVVRDFPLTYIHEHAFEAAMAANAASKQGKFFQYIDLLYRNQTALDTASLKRYAASLGLNAAQFELDLTSEKAAAEIRRDMADGKTYGIGGTPTIFVNGEKVRHLSALAFREAVEKALKRAAPAKK